MHISKNILFSLLIAFVCAQSSDISYCKVTSGKKIIKKKKKINAIKYILTDADGELVLNEKDADVEMAPSSMTKLLTLYVLFSAIKNGQISLNTEFTVSKNAKKTIGSKSFLNEGERYPVDTLIRSIIVHSGNDASIVIAEGVCGSIEKFVDTMNETARLIGMHKSHFCNPTGLHTKGHFSTIRDIAILSKRIINDFPEFYHYFSEKELEVNGIKQTNRNRLLWKNIGVDGLKTGYTDAGGYGLAASASVNGIRLISVVNGCDSYDKRESETERLLNYGFNSIVKYNFVKKGKPIKHLDVWLGVKPTVAAVLDHDISLHVSKNDIHNMKVEFIYRTPIAAPISIGDHLGDLIIHTNNKQIVHKVVAGENIDELNHFDRFFAAIRFMLFGGQKITKEKGKKRNKIVID